jgi:hypothetical protein
VLHSLVADAVFHQQIVLPGDKEARAAGVALTSGAAAQLVIDAAALVAIPDLLTYPPR